MAIAILDPDKAIVNVLADLIEEVGETPQPFTDKDKFLGAISPKAHTIAVISDDFLDVIEGTKQVYQSIDIVALGVNGSDRCILAGASHYLKKPFLAEDFRQVINALLTSPGPQAGGPSGSFIAADPAIRSSSRRDPSAPGGIASATRKTPASASAIPTEQIMRYFQAASREVLRL